MEYLLTWFDHLEELFSYNTDVQFKMFCLEVVRGGGEYLHSLSGGGEVVLAWPVKMRHRAMLTYF